MEPAQFAAVTLHLATDAMPAQGKRAGITRRKLWTGIGILLLGIAALVWWLRPGEAVVTDEIFVIEEITPEPEEHVVPPDPAPAPPQPEQIPDEPPPPPQFGMQQEALSEAGEMSVATGNTLMTQADSVVKAPVAALPAAPEFFDKPPKILSAPDAEYPARELDLGLQGTSVIRIVINTEGRVTRVSVEKSGGKNFDNSALKSARATRFQPYTKNGKPIEAEFIRPYKFEIE